MAAVSRYLKTVDDLPDTSLFNAKGRAYPDVSTLGNGYVVVVGGQTTAELLHLPVDAIHANPRQPRKRFEPEATAGLAASVRHQGVLQPVVVRPRSAGGYELIAGERRWRAPRCGSA